MMTQEGGSKGASSGTRGVFYLHHLPFTSQEPDWVGVVPILGMTKPRFREVKRSPKAKSDLMTQQSSAWDFMTPTH